MALYSPVVAVNLLRCLKRDGSGASVRVVASLFYSELRTGGLYTVHEVNKCKLYSALVMQQITIDVTRMFR